MAVLLMEKKYKKFNIHANRLRQHLSVAFALAFFLNAEKIQKKKEKKYGLKAIFIGCIGITFNWEKNTEKTTKYRLTGFGHIFRPYYYPHIGTKIKV